MIKVITFVAAVSAATAFTPTHTYLTTRSHTFLATVEGCDESSTAANEQSRRQILGFVPAVLLSFGTSALLPSTASAVTATSGKDGNLPDLPSEAVRSYLQYRYGLQLAADFYLFELEPKLEQTDDWGEIGQLFAINNNRGQGNPSRIEREFVNPMRILLLSMPPDVADDMRNAQFKFERAMQTISKATGGYRRDLPVEIDPKAISQAKTGWEDGRMALNQFFVLLNGVTGLPEMREVPTVAEKSKYGRSARRYFDLVKKTKLCQNRGGPALSQAWGQLMVSGYLQDSCGIPDLDEYFYQS